MRGSSTRTRAAFPFTWRVRTLDMAGLLGKGLSALREEPSDGCFKRAGRLSGVDAHGSIGELATYRATRPAGPRTPDTTACATAVARPRRCGACAGAGLHTSHTTTRRKPHELANREPGSQVRAGSVDGAHLVRLHPPRGRGASTASPRAAPPPRSR